jgi:ABC-type nickel/cobalt efflux system permease component RcnA
MRACRTFIGVVAFLLIPHPSSLIPSASAHPVGERTYDRTIAVRLSPDAVLVNYELEVNTATVNADLAALDEDIDLSKCRFPRDYYEAFVRYHAPYLARNLDATLDGKPLTFTAGVPDFEVREQVSLHCRFAFRAPWQPAAGAPHRFTFRDGTFEERSGRIRLSLANDESVTVTEPKAPSEALQAKPLTELAPGEGEVLRRVSASFTVAAQRDPAVAPPAEPAPALAGDAPPSSPWRASSLHELLMYRGEALWLVLAAAAFLGGAHALTPGHGKTLVAAYLVGERGTVGHAVFLGLVTMLSHTGVIIAIAVVVQLVFRGHAPPSLQAWIGVGGGLLVAGMGVWLLLARLTGRADHVHILGGHHHHHGHGHGQADHYHDEQGHAHPLPGGRVGWWRLTVLGVSGGIVPCHDAVALYAGVVSADLLDFALPVLLAFSAGLAAVLVIIGVAVVKAKGTVGARWAESRAFKALPIVSAALVTCIGLWLCYTNLPR